VPARYQDISNQPAAIISCQVDRGKALLAGIHPEYTAASITSSTPGHQEFARLISESEQERLNLWHFIRSIASVG